MIDPNVETILSLSGAAKDLPARRGGKRPHVSCLYRWTTAGCRGVVLESIQIGGTRCTSREALGRFFRRLTAASGSTSDKQQTPAARRRHAAAAEQELIRQGL